jgi:hypothetical protein
MIKGSCICGGVNFELDEEKITMMNNCYCSTCRKVTGSDYLTAIQVPLEDFTWLSGEELVSTFESSPGSHRAFCNVCGSRMPQSNAAWPFITIPAGSLDGDPKVAPQVSIFTASKPPWHLIDDTVLSCEDMGTPEFWGEFMAKQNK